MTQQLPDLVERIIYRDGLILVIDKPAGVPVHAGTGGGINLEQGFDALRFGLPNPPALAHRLDRDTSGCLVLGRHRQALRKMGQLFQSGRVEKTYLAVVKGQLAEKEGRIDLPLAKQAKQKARWWMEVNHEEGQSAITDYRVIAGDADFTWLSLSPRTGRTHQLRVHCAALGHPIIGDTIYNPDCNQQPLARNLGEAPTLHLHAQSLIIPLYPSKDPIRAEAKIPPHMAQMADKYKVTF